MTSAEQVIPSGMLGQGRYVQENKIELLTNQALLFERGVTNANSNDEVAKYYVDQYDEPGAQADIMRPVYDGEGENGNFYPECLIIPLDKENQRNIQDAAEAVLWIARNGMEYMIADEAFTYDGVEYPAGTIVASCIRPRDRSSTPTSALAPRQRLERTVFRGFLAASLCPRL